MLFIFFLSKTFVKDQRHEMKMFHFNHRGRKIREKCSFVDFYLNKNNNILPYLTFPCTCVCNPCIAKEKFSINAMIPMCIINRKRQPWQTIHLYSFQSVNNNTIRLKFTQSETEWMEEEAKEKGKKRKEKCSRLGSSVAQLKSFIIVVRNTKITYNFFVHQNE